MAELFWNVTFFSLVSETAIGTKSPPTYVCIFITQDHQPFLWLIYIDEILFVWTHGKKKLKIFLEKFNKFHRNIKFTNGSGKESILFLDLNVTLSER